MKYLLISTIVITFLLFGCDQNKPKTESTTVIDSTTIKQKAAVASVDDKAQIQDLLRKMLVWSQTKNGIELIPAIEGKDSMYVGFDLEKLKQNLKKLRAAGFFSETFIENYNQIILTLDKKLKNKEFEPWPMGDLPTFRFANDVDPWCNCQDVPYDEPNPFELVEIQLIKLADTTAVLTWSWAEIGKNSDAGWKKFSYKFEVEKENGAWKISYLQGFDFKESTHKDGL